MPAVKNYAVSRARRLLLSGDRQYFVPDIWHIVRAVRETTPSTERGL